MILATCEPFPTAVSSLRGLDVDTSFQLHDIPKKNRKMTGVDTYQLSVVRQAPQGPTLGTFRQVVMYVHRDAAVRCGVDVCGLLPGSAVLR
jgi:hypothetical protein